MTGSPTPNGLRAARSNRGWSLTTEAERIVELGRERGQAVATVSSLRSQISRWENGHALPDPQYRELLADLLGHSAAELGIGGIVVAPGSDPASRLHAALDAAAAVDDAALDLWRDQLGSAQRLDDELGATAAASLVRAQIAALEEALTHTVEPEARRGTAGVLSTACALAGDQTLGGAEPDEAWRSYERARSAAVVAGHAAAEARAVVGLADVLVEVGRASAAVTVLTGLPATDDTLPAPTRARVAAALGAARAALGEAGPARAAVQEAERLASAPAASPRVNGETTAGADLDLADQPFAVELADVHRWRGHVLARLGDAGAEAALREALAAGQRGVRHRADVLADLAAVLAPVDRDGAAEQAREARTLAERIGATRVTLAVTPLMAQPR
jgi:transcriptional regulator with XRE-family HTH domain